MMDAVPYPLNLSATALWKGILYDEDNLNQVYNRIKDINMEHMDKAKKSIIEKGLDGKIKDKTVHEISKWLVDIARDGLIEEEKGYIEPLADMVQKKKTPYDLIGEKAQLGKKEALKNCILNNLDEVK